MRSILSIKSHHSEKLIFFDGFCRWMEEMVLAKLLSHFSRVRLCDPIDGSPLGLPHPWDYPGKNTGVGCHFLLQCMEVKSESEVVQLCPTLSDPMGCSLPGSSIHGIFQARVLEWVAIAFLGCLITREKATEGICVSSIILEISSEKTFFKIFLKNFNLFIYFWPWFSLPLGAFPSLWQVGATLKLRCTGLSLQWLLLSWSTGFRTHWLQYLWFTGSVVKAPGC